MHKPAVAAALVAASLLSASLAAAGESTAASMKAPPGKAATAKKKPAVEVAAPEPPEPLPALPAPPPPAADTPAAPRARDATTHAGPGFVLSAGTSTGALLGRAAVAAPVGAIYAALDLKVSYYATTHVALQAGLRAGSGFDVAGCDDCRSTHFQVPVVSQYAFDDRSRGLYLDGGIGILSTLAMKAEGERLTFRSPVVLKLGIGYRMPIKKVQGRADNQAIDVRLGFDWGSFASASYERGPAEASADIARRAAHYDIGLGASYAFMP